MSVTPAGGNGTMTLTGLLGYCWAKAGPETTSAAPSATMRMNLLISAPSAFSSCFDAPHALRLNDRAPTASGAFDPYSDIGPWLPENPCRFRKPHPMTRDQQRIRT